MEFTKEQKLTQTIINKAWEDEVFKQNLITNPIEAIEKLTGETVVLPAGKQLIVRDQTNKQTIYINIPVKNVPDDMELNENQLEIIAGGSNMNLVEIPGITTKGNSTK